MSAIAAIREFLSDKFALLEITLNAPRVGPDDMPDREPCTARINAIGHSVSGINSEGESGRTHYTAPKMFSKLTSIAVLVLCLVLSANSSPVPPSESKCASSILACSTLIQDNYGLNSPAGPISSFLECRSRPL